MATCTGAAMRWASASISSIGRCAHEGDHGLLGDAIAFQAGTQSRDEIRRIKRATESRLTARRRTGPATPDSRRILRMRARVRGVRAHALGAFLQARTEAPRCGNDLDRMAEEELRCRDGAYRRRRPARRARRRTGRRQGVRDRCDVVGLEVRTTLARSASMTRLAQVVVAPNSFGHPVSARAACE